MVEQIPREKLQQFMGQVRFDAERVDAFKRDNGPLEAWDMARGGQVLLYSDLQWCQFHSMHDAGLVDTALAKMEADGSHIIGILRLRPDYLVGIREVKPVSPGPG